VTLAGTLGVASGGTGQVTLATGALGYGQGTSAHASLAIGTAGQILTVNSGGTAPQWTTLTSVSVTTFSAGTTGLTPASATSGAITLAGTLVVSNGGTGLTSLTAGYIPYGNGTSAFSSTANFQLTSAGNLLIGNSSFYATPSASRKYLGLYGSTDASVIEVGTVTATSGAGIFRINAYNGGNVIASIQSDGDSGSSTAGNLTFGTSSGSGSVTRMTISSSGLTGFGTSTTATSVLQTNGSNSTSAFKTPNIAEVDTISATAATGTINYDVTTQSVLYYTTNASANWTLNFRGSSSTSLNTLMQTGESISATFLVTNGTTAYYNSAVTIDGSSVTPKWQGGTAPTSGNASSVDCYTYVIQKTGSATYAVLASQTKFA
jgi:hypothetical protein